MIMFDKFVNMIMDRKYVRLAILLLILMNSGCIEYGNDLESLDQAYDKEFIDVNSGMTSEFKNSSIIVNYNSEEEKDVTQYYTKYIHVSGEVKNIGNETVSLLAVKAKFYDDDKNLISELYSDQYYENLKPGESVPFDIYCTKGDCEKSDFLSKIEDITQYQVGLCSKF